MIAFRKFLNKKSLRAVTGEFLATLIFVLFSVGSTVSWEKAEEQPLPAALLRISICFGICAAAMVKCFSDISGAHINPAVTLAMVLTRRFHVVKAFFYMLAQCLGATTASAVLFVVTPPSVRGHLGVTWGFIVELLITFQMIFVVFATSDPGSTRLNSEAAVTIGISVAIGHLFAVPYTGASMNPARSLGPAIITGNWDDHWVYWVGPILGAIIGAALHKYFLHPSLKKPAAGAEFACEEAGEDAADTFRSVGIDKPESSTSIDETETDPTNSLSAINPAVDDEPELFNTEKEN